MCVIIQRDKGITIPYDKIKTACTINQDGYGFIVNDRDKFEVIKKCDSKGNDADEVYKLLEDAKDCNIALHLRFRTAGKIDYDNTHPYQVLSKADDGVDLWFMHNGTLNNFKQFNTDYSDSRNLTNVVLKPLLRTAFDKYGEEYLGQEYLHLILKHLKNDTSAFTLNDSFGTRLILPSTLSKEFEGWWASNEYSFRETHTRYTQNTTTYTPINRGHGAGNFTKDTGTKNLPSTTTTRGTATTNTSVPSIKPSAFKNLSRLAWQYDNHVLPQRTHMTAALKMEADYIKNAIQIAFDKDDTSTMAIVKVSPAVAVLPTFEEISGLKDITEISRLTVEEMAEMCSTAPEATAILLHDLLLKISGKSFVRQVSKTKIEQVA